MSTDRIDKWLWHARFFKSRSLSAKLVREGKVRINGTRITKPSHDIKLGDVLTFATGDWIRLIEIVAIGKRRGPAPEAQALYVDRSDPAPIREKVPYNPKYEGKGRPTGKWRRGLHSFSDKWS